MGDAAIVWIAETGFAACAVFGITVKLAATSKLAPMADSSVVRGLPLGGLYRVITLSYFEMGFTVGFDVFH
jgi:hypothetical protein